jgi:hypothetical protein
MYGKPVTADISRQTPVSFQGKKSPQLCTFSHEIIHRFSFSFIDVDAMGSGSDAS